ncbi:MAG: flagellar filament capping protein FliD [Alphaproteobacteria bacterium]|nr:flagellar filament capping protein FliD [Alphaproteobacteria bacterium]
MTDISTGTVASTSTDRLYIVGAASEINTYALIEAAYAQKTAKADNIDVKIEENEAIIDAYTTLQELGGTMLESLKLLKQTYGYSTSGDSVYDDLEVYLAASDDTIVSSVVDVTVDDDAEIGTYSLEIEQIATAMRAVSNSVASKTDALNYDGIFTIATENGTAIEIEVTSDMSLSDINDAINNVSNDTNVSASIVKTAEDSYTLVLAGNVTGEELVYNSISGDDIMQSLGATDAVNAFVDITQIAQDAIIYLDGLEINSSSNSLEDVLEGVNITLYAPTDVGTTITLEVDYDYTAVKDAVTGFVDSYNEFRTFYDTQMTLNSGSGDVSDDSVLFSDSILEQMNYQMSSIMTSIFGDDDGLVTTLAEAGIEFTDDNYIEIADEDLLDDVLLNNYDELRELFQTSVETDNDEMALITNNSTLTDFDITFDITVDGNGDISNVSVGGDTSLFDYDGSRIIGAEGTIYEGLTFAYVSDTSASVAVSISQGMADLLHNSITAYSDTSNGVIMEVINDLQSKNTDLETEADRIRERADAFYDREVLRYAQMEVEVAAAETLLSIVRALLGIDNDD